ncbi:hypothetical protein EDC01DRAFT_609437 [Geopyxis carbonaria]|nr:hypothetical protein EDC01DRAFT_609437 [Geopyxis carbonaria]
MASLRRPRARLPVSIAKCAPGGRRCLTLKHLDETLGDRERITVLGSGWGGYGLLRSLDTKLFQPVLVTPRTHFVFTPLLASTAVGTLEFRTAMESSHSLNGVSVIQASATRLALATPTTPHTITIKPSDGPEFALPTPTLAIAVGCAPQTFNTPGVWEHAYFLRTPADARRLRLRLLSCFDKAALPTTTADEARNLLHFAIIGGGPTGIEFAAELHDLIHDDLARVYRSLAGIPRITVYDVAPTILGMFDANLQAYARAVFKRQGIEVRTEHHVSQVEADAIVTKEDGRVPVGAVVWSTGLAPSPFVTDGMPPEAVRRRHGAALGVDDHLRLLTQHADEAPEPVEGVYALGDCASVASAPGLPATAQVAGQQAKYLARALNNVAKSRRVSSAVTVGTAPVDIAAAEKPFAFRSMGVMAYLGGWRAIMQNDAVDVKGRLSWVLWRMAYLSKSVSWRNRLLIPVYWMLTWIGGRDVNRF